MLAWEISCIKLNSAFGSCTLTKLGLDEIYFTIKEKRIVFFLNGWSSIQC